MILINFGREYCLCGNVGFHECQPNLQDRRSHLGERREEWNFANRIIN
jgi:hypothetical protein